MKNKNRVANSCNPRNDIDLEIDEPLPQPVKNKKVSLRKHNVVEELTSENPEEERKTGSSRK
jgi:hypothetical protein